MPRINFDDLQTPLFDLILIIGGIAGLTALALWVNLPLWVTGIGGLIIILFFGALMVWRYQPDVPDAQFVTEGLDELPGLQDHAEAERKTA